MTHIPEDAFGIEEWNPGFFENIALQIIRAGEVPKHIGIIMDGNRRWARERGAKPIEGHIEGSRVLKKVCLFAEALGVKEITAYSFSTDNMKRSKEEVQGLMDLMSFLCKRQLDEVDYLQQKGLSVRVMGDIELLPKKVRTLIAKAILNTNENKRSRLNLAICYKSSEEIDRAMNTLKQGVNNGDIIVSDIDENLVEKCLYTNKSHPVDFLIRTSGEQRFSDFFLWQANRVPLYFCDVMWPKFTFINFFKAILFYQRNLPKIQFNNFRKVTSKDKRLSDEKLRLKEERVRKFLHKEEQKFLLRLTEMAAE